MVQGETRSHLKPLDSLADVSFVSRRPATITLTHAQFTLWSLMPSQESHGPRFRRKDLHDTGALSKRTKHLAWQVQANDDRDRENRGSIRPVPRSVSLLPQFPACLAMIPRRPGRLLEWQMRCAVRRRHRAEIKSCAKLPF